MTTPDVFETRDNPRLTALISDLSPNANAWESQRDGHTPPLAVSAYTGAETYRDEFGIGMSALGFDSIKPQQMVIADACNAVDEDGLPLHPYMAVQVPRRSGKTETLTALAVGRCLARPGYRVALTFATTGTKLAQKWKTDIFGRLDRWDNPTGVEFKITRSNGHEAVEFGNGSIILLLPPKASAYRSDAFNLAIIDESGEASKALSEELMQAVGPTLDTSPDAQLIIAGTPADFREGNLLHDALTLGLDPEDPDSGLVNYAAPGDLTLEDVETWEAVEPLLLAAHPGIGTLTTLARVKQRYIRMTPLKFAQEYLGQFGRDEATAGALNPSKWNDALLETRDGRLPELPKHFTVGMAVSVDQSASALAAVWRDAEGVAHVGLLRQQGGSAWLPGMVAEFAAKHPQVLIAYDAKGSVLAEAEKIKQGRSRAKITAQTFAHVTTAAALFTRELNTGMLKHYGQRELTEAALTATTRTVGVNSFAFGRPSPDALIVALEAAALALRLHDENPQRERLGVIAA